VDYGLDRRQTQIRNSWQPTERDSKIRKTKLDTCSKNDEYPELTVWGQFGE